MKYASMNDIQREGYNSFIDKAGLYINHYKCRLIGSKKEELDFKIGFDEAKKDDVIYSNTHNQTLHANRSNASCKVKALGGR